MVCSWGLLLRTRLGPVAEQAGDRDFPLGNFWRLIGENEARKEVKKMENVEENEEKWKGKEEKEK